MANSYTKLNKLQALSLTASTACFDGLQTGIPSYLSLSQTSYQEEDRVSWCTAGLAGPTP